MKRALTILLTVFFALSSVAQKIEFKYAKAPAGSGFRMEGYWVWCGSAIKVGNEYHLFASRWKKNGPFPEGYRQGSEIVRAVSDSPYGPFRFAELVIGERDSSYWDSNMAHNPAIYRIGKEYVLFYIGSDFTTLNHQTHTLLRRVGYATSKSIKGPWERCEKPLIEAESNNPAVLAEGNKVKLLYRDSGLRIFMAESDSYKGPFRIVNDNVWPEGRLEDFYLFRTSTSYHIICEDNEGKVSGHVRWGVHLVSENGTNGWQKDKNVIAYDHDIFFEGDSVLRCMRRERPQLLIIRNKISYLYTGVYDGINSWCQPVGITPPVKLH